MRTSFNCTVSSLEHDVRVQDFIAHVKGKVYHGPMAGCFHCGNSFPDDFVIYRSTTCPSCGKDAKVCLNCRFYSPGSHWDCRETISEAVRDKDRANFCDYFSINPSAGGRGTGVRKADKARSQFDSLFNNDE